MKAIVSVIGKDKVGIIAKVSSFLSDIDINIEDISQTVMQDYFTMIMMVDISNAKDDFKELSSRLERRGEEIGVSIRLQRVDLFNAMHKL